MPHLIFKPTDIEIEVPGNSQLDEICEEENIEVVFGCRQGVCGSCKIQVLGTQEGLNKMTEEESHFLDDQEITQGIRLACQCLITGNVTFGIG